METLQDCREFHFNFINQTESQLGQTGVKPNLDLIQNLIEMLTVGLSPGSSFSSDYDAKSGISCLCLGGFLSIFTPTGHNIDVYNWT